MTPRTGSVAAGRPERKARRDDGSILRSYRRLWGLLTPPERRAFSWILAGMTVLGVLDTAGVASIMPFLALAGNPDVIGRNPMLLELAGRVGIPDRATMLIVLGIIVILLIALRNGFSAFMHWRGLRFAWSVNHRMARAQLDRYMHRPYIYFVQHNTAGAQVNILSEVNTITNSVVTPSMEIVTGSVSAIGVVGFLLYVDWKLAILTSLVLGGAYAVVYYSVRGKLRALGRLTVQANRARFQSVSEALGGIKELIALGRRDEFVRRFSVPSRVVARHRVAYRVISQTPRYVLETLAFTGIIFIVIYLLAERRELGGSLAILGLYAVAGYRLLPALQGVFAAVTAVRYNMAAVDFVYEDFFEQEEYPPVPRRDRPPIPLRVDSGLRLQRVRYRYPGSPVQAVQDIDIEVQSRHTVALVGQTGAGKTTLVDIILGLLVPQEGRLEVDGVPIEEHNLPEWQAAVGYVPQSIYLADDTIERNIAFGIPDEEIDLEKVREAARVAQLDRFIESLPRRYRTVVGERGVRLSGGQRQRIGIARALYHDPPVLLFDEATSALDGITEEEVMQDIRGLAERKTIILIAHRLSTVRHAHSIYLLDRGRVVDRGTYDELMRENAVFRRMSSGISL